MPSRAECRSPEQVRILWLCLVPDTSLPTIDRTRYALSNRHKISPINELYSENLMGNTGESMQMLRWGIILWIYAQPGSLALTCDDRNSQPTTGSSRMREMLLVGTVSVWARVSPIGFHTLRASYVFVKTPSAPPLTVTCGHHALPEGSQHLAMGWLVET